MNSDGIKVTNLSRSYLPLQIRNTSREQKLYICLLHPGNRFTAVKAESHPFISFLPRDDKVHNTWWDAASRTIKILMLQRSVLQGEILPGLKHCFRGSEGATSMQGHLVVIRPGENGLTWIPCRYWLSLSLKICFHFLEEEEFLTKRLSFHLIKRESTF